MEKFNIISFIVGALFLLIGISGGGFKIKELDLGKVEKVPRVLAFILGLVFVVIGLADYLDIGLFEKKLKPTDIIRDNGNAEEDAKIKAEEDAKKKAEEDAKIKAEEDAKIKAEEDAKIKAEEDAKKKAQADLEKRELPKANFRLEFEINRQGSDYKSFSLPEARPELCRDECLEDPNCKAFTYVKPGYQLPDKAVCWLKDSVPPPTSHAFCVSGVK